MPKKGQVNEVRAKEPKLMTKGKFALCIAAVMVGAALQPVREYRASGIVTKSTVISAVIGFCLGLALVLAIGWWANRPERGGLDE